MPTRWIFSIGMALLATGASAASPARDPLPVPTMVTGGAIDANGTLWFSGWTEGVSFYLPPNDPIDAHALFRTLKAANGESRMVIVTFDPTSGRFDEPHDRIAYRICALASGEEHYGQKGGSCPTDAASAPFGTAIQQPLALGVADSATGRAASIGELDAALRDAGLDPRLQLIALRARAEAHSLAALKNPASADMHLVAALHDVAAWRALAPEDRDAWLKAAALLADLGAYDDSIQAYRAIAVHWTDEKYRSAVRIGAIYRVEGRYKEALAELDHLVETDGPQPGMKFHYHRGWTLTLLGRFDEAIRDLSEGLTTQPDYPWAYLRRACAYAAIGRIKDAAADQRLGAGELATLMAADTEPLDSERADVARTRAVADQLDALAAKASSSPVRLACEGYSEDQPKRSRSALLTSPDLAAALKR